MLNNDQKAISSAEHNAMQVQGVSCSSTFCSQLHKCLFLLLFLLFLLVSPAFKTHTEMQKISHLRRCRQSSRGKVSAVREGRNHLQRLILLSDVAIFCVTAKQMGLVVIHTFGNSLSLCICHFLAPSLRPPPPLLCITAQCCQSGCRAGRTFFP